MFNKTNIAFLFITLLSIYGCQITPASHKPLLLDLNNNDGFSDLSLKFTISDNGSNITLFKGYSFIAKLSSTITLTTPVCSVIGASSTNTNFTGTVDVSERKITCAYNGTSTGLALSGTITVKIANVAFSAKSYNKVSLGLYTSADDNGVLIVHNPAFRSFSLYDNYTTDSTGLTLSNGSVSNLSTSLECTSPPCSTLYPYSDFQVTFDVAISSYINTKESYIWIKLDGNFVENTLKLSSTSLSTASSTDPVTVDTLLASALKSSSSDGALSLTKVSNGLYIISDIATYVTSTDYSIFMLDEGRSFKLTISGLSTGSNVSVSALNTIEMYASWKNTNSNFSYSSFNLANISKINTLKFYNADDTTKTVNSSVSHTDGTEIYENGAWPLSFNLRIPKIEAGTLTITSTSSTNVVFSLIASTCDFSSDTTVSNAFGTRPVCAPTNYVSGGLRRTFTTTGTGNDSGIDIKFDGITSNYKDFKLNLWGYANKCTDYTYASDAGLYLDSVTDTSKTSNFSLSFTYTYKNSNGDIIATSNVSSSIKCYKNYRFKSSTEITQFNTGTSNTGFTFLDETTSKDYLLYTEITNWNPTTGITYTAAVSPSPEVLNISSLTPNTFLNSLPTSTDTDLNLNFSIATAASSTIITPYNFKSTTDGDGNITYAPQLLPGKFVIKLPSYLATVSSSSSTCVMSLYTDTAQSKNSIFHTGGFTLDSTNLTLTTGVINDTTATTPVYALNYKTTDATGTGFGFYSNCFTINTGLAIKSIFQHASMFVNYQRGTASFSTNRVNRFFKFFNGLTYGFTNPTNTNIQTTTPQINSYRPYLGNTSFDNLCIIEIVNAVFGQMQSNTNNASINTLVITLQNNRLAKIGDYSATDYYPVSTIVDSVNAYPLYSIEATTLAASQDLTTSDGINTGFLFDSSNVDHIVPYFGNSIYFDNAVTSITSDDSDVYLPVPCGANDNEPVKASIQGFYMSGSVVQSSGNVIYYSGASGSETTFYTTAITGATATYESDLILSFGGYRTSQTPNTLSLSGLNNASTGLAALLLVNDIDIDDTVTNGFFSQSYVSGNYSGVKINDKSYSGYYFATSSAITISNASTITFLTRPSYITYLTGGQTVKLHAVGTYLATPSDSSSTVSYYFTNTENSDSSKNLIAADDAYTSTDSLLSFIITPIDTLYNSDKAGNIKITATITTDFATTGTLIINSTNFNTYSTCVFTSDITKSCSISGSNMTCSNLSLTTVGSNTASFDCYNVSVSSTGTITISTSSSFAADSSILNINLKPTDAYTYTSSLTDISTIIPTIASINHVQAQNKGALSNAYIRINLGRSYRLGQTVVVTGSLDSLFITSNQPTCSFMLVSTSTNYDSINFYDNSTSGAYFIDTCVFGTGSGASFTLTLKTKNYLPIESTFSRYILVKLSPVYVADLSALTYSISTYIGNTSTTLIAGTSTTSPNFPAPTLDSTAYTVTAATTTGLCDLSSIFPRIPATSGQFTFKVTLSGTSDLLTTVNANSTNKRLNEISIYMNPSIYMRNENILCQNGTTNVPCTWTQQGYINIKFSSSLSDGDYTIIISGITVPQISSTLNSGDFNCSVNYFNNDSREALIVGLGTSSIYTYSPTNSGNIIEHISDNGMTSTTNPRTTGSFYFRFNLDFTLSSPTSVDFTATTEGNFPTLMVGFPSSQYNFYNAGAVTATLTYTTISTTGGYTTYGDPTSIQVSSAAIQGNFIVITMSTATFTVDSTTAYFDLTVSNVPTPWSEVNSSLINLFILNDLDFTNNTTIYSTYPNLNNVIGGAASTAFNDYYQGPSFAFSDNTMALINYGTNNMFNLMPGRYQPLTFTVSGQYANASTTLALTSNTTITSLDTGITLNTGLNKTGQLRLGVSCSTLPGSYWASFTMTNTTGNFYGINPLRVIVSPVTGNLASLYTNSSINTLSSSLTYTILNGAFTRVYINARYPVVDDVNITLTPATTNDRTFALYSASGKQNITAGNMSSYFSYKINGTVDATTNTISNQSLSLSSGNRCFGFGSSASTSTTITYTIDASTTVDISNINISTMFTYDNTVTNPTEFVFSFTPVAYTTSTWALVCTDSDYPTYATATSDNIANLDSMLYKVQTFNFLDDTTAINVTFDNLQRGTTYKLKIWVATYNVDNNSLKYLETATPNNSTDATPTTTTLVTPSVADKQFMLFNFGSQQTTAFTDRLQLLTQLYFNTNAGATVYVGKATTGGSTTYVEGYTPKTAQTCSSTYFSTNYADTQAISDNSTSTSTDSTTTTRILADSAESFYFIIQQSDSDSSTFDAETVVNTFASTISDADSLKTFVETSSVKMTGTVYSSSRVTETAYTTADFSMNSIAYDATTGIISLIPVGNYDITCNWKLNNSVTTLSSETILDCATTATDCGTIAFVIDNTATTSLTVGTLTAGSYYVNVLCASSIPDSTNQIIFQNANAIVVEDTTDTSTTDTTTDPTTSTNSDYIKFSLTFLALLAIVLFDF